MRVLRVIPVLVALLFALPAQAQTVTGPATVIDGDTLEVRDERIRIIGIDACESRQKASLNGQEWPCGIMATAWMVLGKVTRCVASKRDRYKRLLAVCRVDGEDLGAGIIRDGLAVAYRYRGNAPNPEYLPIEAEAKRRVEGCGGVSLRCLGSGGSGSSYFVTLMLNPVSRRG
ncbi:thermonuclease family protein [Pelagibius sp. Alg239-R121]|uniref:thermonuclease family protein n=1 Tax=Pelagibius sp. Alg239-R121 TaxID=2993448 RepID=UPI0024A71FBD|nr:thermonuclease family protein [Pelagibius sp. Alg239-R121]